MFEPAKLMQLAIEKCREGIARGQSPFGCAIARGDEVLAICHNRVLESTDITAHAEINALREACRISGDIFLESAVVASTCEPCPMCMAALHWARVETVFFGATIADADAAGFNEISISAADVIRLGNSRVNLHGNLLVDECRELFQEWKNRPDCRAY